MTVNCFSSFSYIFISESSYVNLSRIGVDLGVLLILLHLQIGLENIYSFTYCCFPFCNFKRNSHMK